MWDHAANFARHGVEVRIVTFENQHRASQYAASTTAKWPLLIDGNRDLFRGYGFDQASWWALYNPVSILKYLWLMLRGTLPGTPGSDWNQLGGNVLIDPMGIVKLVHASQNPHDRPTVSELLSTIAVEGA